MSSRVLLVLALWAGCETQGDSGCTSPVGSDGPKPVIDELRAINPTVISGDTTTVAVTARDLDGEALSYVWSKSAGTFEGALTGNTIVWRAPTQTGEKTVTVRVVNESGRNAIQTIPIQVTNVPTPIVVIDYPAEGAFIPASAASVTVQARITNTADVDSAKCFVNGVSLGRRIQIQNPTFTWNVTGLSGPYKLVVQAWSDFAVAGQQQTDSAAVTVNIEGTIGKQLP